MITRGADDATAMMFNASLPDGKASVFKDALAGKQLMAPPAPVTRHLKEKGEEIIEITEFEAPPQYSYRQVNTEALNLRPSCKTLCLRKQANTKPFRGLTPAICSLNAPAAMCPACCALRLRSTAATSTQVFTCSPKISALPSSPLRITPHAPAMRAKFTV